MSIEQYGTEKRTDWGNGMKRNPKVAEAMAAGITESCYKARIKRGWSHERAVNTPAMARKPRNPSNKPVEQGSPLAATFSSLKW